MLSGLLRHLFRLEKGEWPKLLQFGMLGFLLQMGLGVGFSAGDAAFLSNVGAAQLPLVFLLTPLVMLVHTGLYSFLLVRTSIDYMVDLTLAVLAAGGVVLWALMSADLAPEWQTLSYYILKLYLAMWYIALYTLFWSYTDTYFHIQDAKRLFPLFAAFCALGTASGALVVHQFAAVIPTHYFLLFWSFIAIATMPLVRMLRRRWRQIAEDELNPADSAVEAGGKLSAVFSSFRNSRYAQILTLGLFVTLLMTNLIEYQYSTVLQSSRTEAELAGLFGALYAGAGIFNIIVCLFVFNRLVSRIGVRNVAFILPITYFAVFGYFFLQGGYSAAVATFFAYHGVMTSIEYNNQNLLFNAVPSTVKKPLRAIVEGMCEPMASFLAGGYLLYAAKYVTLRELSGIGVMIGAILIVITVILRQSYPAAMAKNMRHGWLNFGDQSLSNDGVAFKSIDKLQSKAACEESQLPNPAQSIQGVQYFDQAGEFSNRNADQLAAMVKSDKASERMQALHGLSAVVTPKDIHLIPLLLTGLSRLGGAERKLAIAVIGKIGDTEAIPDILTAAGPLAMRDRRAIAGILVGFGETAIPCLVRALCNRRHGYRERSVAARVLAEVSYAQFVAQLDQLVRKELTEAHRVRLNTQWLDAEPGKSTALTLLVRAQHERISTAVDFVLELLALSGKLPNFDLLIVSLHSTNPKVRANALEAIESSVDHKTYRSIEALLKPDWKRTFNPTTDNREILHLLEAALDAGHAFEAAAALEELHKRLPKDEFVRKIRTLIHLDMPAFLQDQLVEALGLDQRQRVGVIALVDALRRTPDYAAASLEALVALTTCARFSKPSSPAVEALADDRPFWIRRQDIREVASRHPDLALVLLRAQDEKIHAA